MQTIILHCIDMGDINTIMTMHKNLSLGLRLIA